MPPAPTSEALVALVKAIALPLGLLAIARLVGRYLDDGALLRPPAVGALPLVAGAAVAFSALRGSGLLAAFDLLNVWSEDSIWHVSWRALVAGHLAPEGLLTGLFSAKPLLDRKVAAALAIAGLALAAVTARAALLRGPRRAWRGAVLFVLWSSAWAAILHAGLILAFWAVHWLNFWLFFILLLFVELRRREGEGGKYQAS